MPLQAVTELAVKAESTAGLTGCFPSAEAGGAGRADQGGAPGAVEGRQSEVRARALAQDRGGAPQRRTHTRAAGAPHLFVCISLPVLLAVGMFNLTVQYISVCSHLLRALTVASLVTAHSCQAKRVCACVCFYASPALTLPAVTIFATWVVSQRQMLVPRTGAVTTASAAAAARQPAANAPLFRSLQGVCAP